MQEEEEPLVIPPDSLQSITTDYTVYLSGFYGLQSLLAAAVMVPFDTLQPLPFSPSRDRSSKRLILLRLDATCWTDRGSNPGTGKRFFLPPKVLTNFGVYEAFYSAGQATGLMSISHLRLTPRLRISGVLFLLPFCDFVSRTNKALPFVLYTPC